MTYPSREQFLKATHINPEYLLHTIYEFIHPDETDLGRPFETTIYCIDEKGNRPVSITIKKL